MALKDILDKLAEKQAESKVDPLECDPRVRSGAEGLVRAAKLEVERLEREYKSTVLKSAIVIAVHGSGAQQFAQISQSIFKTLAVDFYAVVSDVSDAVKSRGGQTEYNTQEHWLVMSELQRIQREYEIYQLAPPTINYQADNVYLQPIQEAVQNLFYKNYGHSLYSAVSRVKISNMALAAQFDGKALPVVLYNCNGDVDNRMLPVPILTVQVDSSEVTEDFVKNVLRDAKNKLKKEQELNNNQG